VVKADKLLNIEKKVNLSEIADTVFYISPEYTKDLFPGDYSIVQLTEKNLVIVDEFHRIFIYDRSGKLINCIDRNGRGPGEYSDMTGLWVGRDTIIVLDRASDFLSYTFDGRFIGHIKLSGFSPRLTDFFGQPMILSQFSLMTEDENPFLMHVYSADMKFKMSIFHRERNNKKPTVPGLDYFNLYRLDPDTVFYRSIHSDTIYSLLCDGKILPRFIVSFNKGDENHVVNSSEEINVSDYSALLRVIETQRHLFLDIVSNSYRYTPMFSKETGTGYNVYFNYELLDNGFHNDFDGGYPFLPVGAGISAYTGEMYMVLNPITFRPEYNDPYYRTIQVKYPDRAAFIKNYIETAGEETNPLIMVVR